MADLERGERIKALRIDRHLTQPAVADLVGVTLRAYQEWEAGGGIQWENAKRLARVLSATPEYVMRGPAEAPVDDGAGASPTVEKRFDAIEEELRRLTAAVSKLVAAEARRAQREARLQRLPRTSEDR